VIGSGTINTTTHKATFTTSTLAVGTHSITAAYQGSANYNISTSAALSQVIN
jgi:Bacterial Ig-like domain (group 3)